MWHTLHYQKAFKSGSVFLIKETDRVFRNILDRHVLTFKTCRNDVIFNRPLHYALGPTYVYIHSTSLNAIGGEEENLDLELATTVDNTCITCSE